MKNTSRTNRFCMSGYQFVEEAACWLPEGARPHFAYSDGDEVERRIYESVLSVADRSSVSAELVQHITDWPSKYHLSPLRGNLLRPFKQLFGGRILEVGAGCGAITRFLGECGGEVVAVEGSQIRATIAAARCKGLSNVNVIVDAFHRLPPSPTYDVVTLVGVLEYARRYFPSEGRDPIDALIQHAKAFLKPEGVLIVAIENQLGLKYFAGCGEDHVGIPMFGIEDRYDATGVVTFGRRELQGRLFRAGLSAQNWWFPFPDYKLPTVLVSDRALSGSIGEDMSAVVGPSFNADPQLPRLPLFMLDRAWAPVVRNGLGPELANSFLVIAGRQESAVSIEGIGDAYHFAVERKPEYAKAVVFNVSPSDSITVRQELLFPERKPTGHVPVKLSLDTQTEFVDGQLWTQTLRSILTTDGWSIDDLTVWAQRWYRALLVIAGMDGTQAATRIVPGSLLDAVPRNMLVRPNGEVVFIDQEWSIDLPLELGFLVFRGIYLSLLSVGRVAPPAQGTSVVGATLFLEIVRFLGMWLVEADLSRYAGFESDIQKWVSDRSGVRFNDVLSFSLDVRHPMDLQRSRDEQIADLHRVMAERDGQIAALSQTLSERDGQVAELGRLMVQRDGQLAGLSQTLSERDGQVAELGRLVVERDGQIAGLGQTLSERDRQVAELGRLVVERDGQIAGMNLTIEERESTIRSIVQTGRITEQRIGELGTLNRALQRESELQRQDLTRLSDWANGIEKRPMSYAIRRHSYLVGRAMLRALPVRTATKQKLRDSALAVTRPMRLLLKGTKGGREDSVSVRSVVASDSNAFLRGRDVFVFSIIDWHFRIQRPQHLARSFAKLGRRVFFISNHFVDANECGYQIENLDPSLALFQVKLHVKGAPAIYFAPPTTEAERMIEGSLAKLIEDFGVASSISIAQHAYWFRMVKRLPNSYRVYDCMDHHEGFGNVPEQLIEIEKDMLRQSDLVVVTSSWLESFARDYNPRVLVIRNAGEYEHFAVQPVEVFSDPSGRKIVGYYGAIAEWFDVELIRSIARRNPECLVLLVGSDTVGAGQALVDLPNVQFTGEVPYARLPYYLYAFDVCLLPFKVIPLTLATNPVKVYEYLASGKPVVCVDLPEIAQFGDLVVKAASAEEYVDKVSLALATAPSEEITRARRQFAAAQTWDHRVAQLDDAICQLSLPKVSVIVLTYNNLDLTKACLTSLLADTNYPNLELIVVDNASTDGSPTYLEEFRAEHPDVKIILNEKNLGFAAGNNVGLAAATGDYLVVLNNDTVVTSGWMLTLLRHLQDDPSIGLIGPVTNNIGNEARIETCYRDIADMPAEALRYTLRHMGKTYPMRTAAFFCVMFPRSVYEACGPICEDYGRGFFEDDDYCRRVESIGKRVVCADDVFVHHHLSASFNKLKDEERQELFRRNKATYESMWGPWVPHAYRTM